MAKPFGLVTLESLEHSPQNYAWTESAGPAGSLEMATNTLFLYGTLKRGQANNSLIAGQEFLGPARTAPGYRLYDSGPFPCLVEDRQRGVAVRGELWEVEESLLPKLDEWEEVPRLFVRGKIDVPGVSTPVFAYLYQGDLAGMKDSGDHWPSEPEPGLFA